MLHDNENSTKVKATRRVGIEHLELLKPVDFINLMKILENDFKGILSKSNITIREKIDGCGLRFGVDENGKFFIESSHSGPIFNVGEFTEYSIQKKGVVDSFSQGYDTVLKILQNFTPLVELLREYLTYGGKVICEMLFNPFGKIEGKGITFISTKYDRTKLANIASFILFDIIDNNGNSINKKEELIEKIKKLSNPNYLFSDNIIDFKNFDFTIDINNFNRLLKKFKDIERILTSRKKVDKDLKTIIKTSISEFQKELADKIIKTIGSSKFGLKQDDFEGIVLNTINGRIIKITSPKFKKFKKEQK